MSASDGIREPIILSPCSGNIRDEPGAVVCRVSASFIRFGTFQLPASREEFLNIPRLADYVIRHHYPQFQGAHLPRCGTCLLYHPLGFPACMPGKRDCENHSRILLCRGLLRLHGCQRKDETTCRT